MGLVQHPSLSGRGARQSPTRHELNLQHVFSSSLSHLDLSDPIDNMAHQLLQQAACFTANETIARQSLLETILPNEAHNIKQLQAENALHRLFAIGLLEREGDEFVSIHPLLSEFILNLSL